ncbi:uncharacterized protein LOC128861915 [Anastrepha ludens]|uniref:uncharacterized protein LOC128861915 n=1 Tax=Anastrepha ludens TaxID=28586 RepID=UPI0023B062D7|nr:uncharacterized protein LOC128861915 [Anastrepha ludens]
MEVERDFSNTDVVKLAPPVVLPSSNTITIETTTSTSSPQHSLSGGVVGVSVSGGASASAGLGTIGIGSTLCSSGDSGISSSTPSLVSQLSPPPTIICNVPTSSVSNNIANVNTPISVGAAISSSAAAAGRCSPIISGGFCALTNGLAAISVCSHTGNTSIYGVSGGGGGSGGGSASNCNIIGKPKSSLSPLQSLSIGGSLSSYGGSSGVGVGSSSGNGSGSQQHTAQ